MNEIMTAIFPLLLLLFMEMLQLTFGGREDSFRHSVLRVGLTVVPWLLLIISYSKVYSHNNLTMEERTLIVDAVLSMIVSGIGAVIIALTSENIKPSLFYRSLHLTLGLVYLFCLAFLQ